MSDGGDELKRAGRIRGLGTGCAGAAWTDDRNVRIHCSLYEHTNYTQQPLTWGI